MALDAQTYLEHVTRDGERIAEAAEGHLDDPVPTCPGNTVGSLLLHTAGTCIFWTGSLVQNGLPDQPDWSTLPTDPIELHRQAHERFVTEIAGRDPDQPTWTWAGEGPTGFWYRRAAQELAVHRWDFENAVGSPLAIDPTLAADGIDEFFFVFGPKSDHPVFKGASERFAGSGETLRFEPTDVPLSWTIRALPDRFEADEVAEPDVTARGTACDLLLFLWGRVPTHQLEVTGDVSLLDRWQERVKI